MAEASLLSFFGLGTSTSAEGISTLNSQNVQLPLPQVALVTSTNGDASTTMNLPLSAQDEALSSSVGPLGTQADLESGNIDTFETNEISFYTVKKGDTVGLIAKMFDVSSDTIRWANDLPAKSSSLSVGDTLIIPSVSGVIYTIKKGDTLRSIAKALQADVEDIGKLNGLEADSKLTAGDTIIVPDGKIVAPKPITKTPTNSGVPVGKGPVIAEGKIGSMIPAQKGGEDASGVIASPTAGACILSQGLHQKVAVDIACPLGTPIHAALDGKVIVAKDSGLNYGYGRYVVVQSYLPDGTSVQTLYAHMLKTLVSVGQTVNQGDVVGNMGSSGHSTGPHVHFEVRGAQNPFAKYRVGAHI